VRQPYLAAILGRKYEGGLEPERRLSCRWSGLLGDTVVTFELTPTGTGTRLRLEHSGWSDENKPHRDLFGGGWTRKLSDRLRRVLEGRLADRHAGAEASDRGSG
jgi:activator of Hsp90 ATPase-like protein